MKITVGTEVVGIFTGPIRHGEVTGFFEEHSKEWAVVEWKQDIGHANIIPVESLANRPFSGSSGKGIFYNDLSNDFFSKGAS